MGPVNPYKTQQFSATRNTLAGYVEEAHVSEFQFETQRRTFHSYGMFMRVHVFISFKLLGSSIGRICDDLIVLRFDPNGD